jgi:hypothetical protein
MSMHYTPSEYICQLHAEHTRRLAQTTHLRSGRRPRRFRSKGV